MGKNDSLGDRMKENYENRTRFLLPRRSNVLIRIDGKAFHSYTKGLDRPVDEGLTDDMNLTTKYLCENIQGAKFGYVQSDEISIWVTDYDDIQTDAWFDYNLQKMCSISASMATSKFNQLRMARANKIDIKLAQFDARVFVIPELDEVVNYFVWRQQDATRNSISMAAQSMFSHKELQGKSSTDMMEMMFTLKDTNWDKYPAGFKRGRCVIKMFDSEMHQKMQEECKKKKEFVQKQDFENAAYARMQERNWMEKIANDPDAKTVRKKWKIVDPPIFTQDRRFIKDVLINDEEPDLSPTVFTKQK